MKIGFIGLGKLGLPCAEACAKKGHAVLGYDIAPVESDYVIVEESIKDVVEPVDIVFVAVPTPHKPEYDGRLPTAHLPPKDFSYDIVTQVLTETNKHVKSGHCDWCSPKDESPKYSLVQVETYNEDGNLYRALNCLLSAPNLLDASPLNGFFMIGYDNVSFQRIVFCHRCLHCFTWFFIVSK